MRITMEEVKRSVWDCAGSKSPGPDGFNFNFIKRTWEIIKTFISGRQILDGALLANEIILFANQSYLKLLCLKVDFEKAFDSVCWSFLNDTMVNMGFGEKWRSWIHGYLSSASVSVLVNGSPTGEFSMTRGLRQGDPLSFYLFLMVAESLQVMTIDACSKRIFPGIYLPNVGGNISFLQYADDALFFGA
ncbi:putative RNA-directed DNA polymerase, eukaryota, reverse transcriptase zinc-binding domain protein [Tanacetum coccineum]